MNNRIAAAAAATGVDADPAASTSTNPPPPISSSKDEVIDAGLKIGFIGCGTIAMAIVKGILRQKQFPVNSIAVSRRSRTKSQALALKYPDVVTVYDDMQELVNQAVDMVFLCVLPDQMEDVLKDVTFDQKQTKQILISIVASADLEYLAKLTHLPMSRLAKMICTPSIANHDGVCLLLHRCQEQQSDDDSDLPASSPRPPTITKHDNVLLPQLLNAIGGCLHCHSEQQMNTLMSGMCVMGPMYGLLQTHIQWMTNQGISKCDAELLVTRQYHAIVKDAIAGAAEEGNKKKSHNSNGDDDYHTTSMNNNNNRVEELIAEQTKDGINEQALDNWRRSGALDAYTSVLDAIQSRLEGESDGSLLS